MSDYGPLFAGLDPGASGGFGLLDAEGQFQAAYPWPATERDACDLLAEYAPNIRLAWLESVHSFPDQGISSTFKFGASYGLLRGFLLALKIPFEDVSPQRWTRALGLQAKRRRGRPLSSNSKKNLHKSWAQQWFPRLQLSHATADAILIAEYGRRSMAVPPLMAAMEETRELV